MKKRKTVYKNKLKHPQAQHAVAAGVVHRPIRILAGKPKLSTSAKSLFHNMEYHYGPRTRNSNPKSPGIPSGVIKMASQIGEYFLFLAKTNHPLRDIIKYNIALVDYEQGGGYWIRVLFTKGTHYAHKERVEKLLINEGFIYKDKEYAWQFYRTDNYLALGWRSKRSGYTPYPDSSNKKLTRDLSRYPIIATGHPSVTSKPKKKRAKNIKTKNKRQG